MVQIPIPISQGLYSRNSLFHLRSEHSRRLKHTQPPMCTLKTQITGYSLHLIGLANERMRTKK